jgi:HEAT repeat protein
MFKTLKTWNLASSLKSKGNAQEAYSAVLELGRLADDKAVDLLVSALARLDGVARSAARELGKIKAERAIAPLVGLLSNSLVNQAAAEALVAYGEKAIPHLVEALKTGDGHARQLAAFALGEIRDKRAVDPLILAVQTDETYSVRTAAVTALGQIKDSRAIWVLVSTLQMRDETTPERQAALEQLRVATQLAMRKIGDPLAAGAKPGSVVSAAHAVVEEVEKNLAKGDVHPRLLGDLKLLTNDELVEVLKELIGASEEMSWAKLESREPMLPVYFRSYEQRSGVAEVIGKELHRRGGVGLLKQVLEQQLNNYEAINNWWSGIGGRA